MVVVNDRPYVIDCGYGVTRQLVDAGLDMLWVSIDGASPQTYADVRIGAELRRRRVDPRVLTVGDAVKLKHGDASVPDADAVAAENFGAARSAVAALKASDGGRAAIVLGDDEIGVGIATRLRRAGADVQLVARMAAQRIVRHQLISDLLRQFWINATSRAACRRQSGYTLKFSRSGPIISTPCRCWASSSCRAAIP